MSGAVRAALGAHGGSEAAESSRNAESSRAVESSEAVESSQAVESQAAAGRLAELAVRDLALIDRLRIEFAPGLNVVTGETGAGKSLLIDALSLALGARADTSLVRHGADSARVEALFDRLPEPLICVREVAGSGRSTARVDDETVTAARLAEVAGRLVEIHGQHDQQRLLDERRQRDLLDAYGRLGERRAAVAAAVEAWRANQAALAELAIDPRELARRIELREHEAGEIARAKLRAGEADEIRGRLTAAQHAEASARGSVEIHEARAGEGSGARDLTAAASVRAAEVAAFDPRFRPLADRLAGLAAELEDAASEARDLAEAVEHDPAALAMLEERLSLISSLERTYGDDEAAVIAYGEQAAAEAAHLRDLDSSRAVREAEAQQLLDAVGKVAAALRTDRERVAAEIGTAIEAALADLGFRQVGFGVRVTPRQAGPTEPSVDVGGVPCAFDSTGADSVVYEFAPNPGEPARPLARIASGGELSRVALAIEEVLAGADRTPTLVFDEIDAGIGGRSAEPVGRSLWTLAREHEVLCVTHLAQIAAYADAHFRIEKHERDGRTVTTVRRLDGEDRTVELAQMLAGADGGEAAVASAEELLARAAAWRNGAGEQRP